MNKEEQVEDWEEIRSEAFKRTIRMLKNPKAVIPPGQLLAFVARVGIPLDKDDTPALPAPKTMNVLNMIMSGGLPADRQKELLSNLQGQLATAQKALEESNGER